MTKPALMIAAAIALAGGLGMSVAASAQSAGLSAALSSGAVGEQADGYMGVAGSVSDTVRKEVESINIKRRQVYTDLAGKRGVTVQDAAAATACQTLSRLKAGQAYRIGAGAWQTKGAAAIALPSYCASAG
ncbi:YdbL family protein [Sphingobium sp. C100]|uniref:YdbL family protein n=1 Tax=Sphingobium sp. C100 TaxID=1207055 RepID=UPI00040982D7|nr:YdbL family protein [Sphingobium sp. C100]